MDLIDTLNWRYAVKKYDEQKVPKKKIDQILKAISLTATSAGLQPYRLFVINNEQVRWQLARDSFNAQITEASHLIAFAAFETITKEQITEFIAFMAKERGLPETTLDSYKSSLEQHILARTDHENFIWSSQQAYIALGTGMIAAANAEVDATPMEGFNPEKLDRLLNLREKGLKSVLLLALGYRDAEKDFLANQKKVRLPLKELVTHID
ncbi:NAD(P)H-dependent oxidoreductase [Allomuricauda sp. SCSIO 65647]|uniref:NAD(P)H-dependent oxidoreductase n=1 Tax=Allomuricauda sp. SCSIO 65647 TaxID=2908843 RepID=UPI001F30739B|nr:NAD(P)H-dependent oxidoreductase [Muricauda sp. SCSIO 65647]UJH66669.1 NAD(P)H-dependent oxidoreductase [Muricauda sp. SCSIO 65647]